MTNILKPVDEERLVNSINLICRSIPGKDKYVKVHSRGMTFNVRQKDIIFIEKVYNKCTVYTDKFTYVMVTPLSYFEKELDPGLFIKTHQAFIANREKILGVTSKGNMSYDLQMKGTDKKVLLSRGMNEKLHLTKQV